MVQGKGGAVEKQSNIFNTYTIESDVVNGHKHYTSLDGTMALAFNTNESKWYIQDADKR